MPSGNESWEEVRYHVLGQLPELNSKIRQLDDKLGTIETKLETGMSIITTKMTMITFLGSTITSIIVGVIVAYLSASGAK